MDLRVPQSRSKEHQQEVNQLLGRTEMQASVQGGVPSQRALAGPLFQKEKHNPDNNAQVLAVAALKGKKRKKIEHFSEPSKRERVVKPQDSELNVNKQDRNMKAEEIAAITDKDGSLSSLVCVDKLIVLMQQERADGIKRLADLALRRSMLAGVIAATDREDCLNRFVQLGGLPLLDDWLQDAHKGKAIDGGSPKEGEKAFEDLLLTLLRALDKLPVDLDALKTCIVGRSVNTLRGHKNIEIQKKARKLVDIWKKRVEAEMKQSGEGKVGPGISWSCKQHPTDSLHSHSSSKNGGSDVALKTGGLVSSAKAASNVSGNSSDGISNPPEVVPPLGKASTLFSSSLPGHKDSCRLSNSNTAADFSAKEEKSSCSSHSQNHASHWSNTSVKSSSALLNSKLSGPISRSAGISCKGPVGPISNGIQKESALAKPMWSRSNAVSTDKLVNAAALSEKGSCEAGNIENSGSQRLIVRLPNPGKSPLRVASGGTVVCVAATLQERIAPLITSELPDVKSRQGSNPSTITGSEVNSIPRGCNASIPVFADGDTDLHSAMTPTKDTNEGEKMGEEFCQTTNPGPSADGKSITEEKCLPVGVASVSTSSAQKNMIEGSILADKRRGENASQICQDAEGSSVQPKIIALGMNDGPSGTLAKVAADDAVTCQGVNSAVANDSVQAEQGAEDVDVQSRCRVDTNLGCTEANADVESSKYMSNSLSPATSSSDNAQSLESSRNRVKVASKGQANGDGKKSASRKNFGEDGDMLEDKSSMGASSSEGDLATLEHVVELKRDFSTEIRGDVAGTEMDVYKKTVYQLNETTIVNFTDPSNESMNKESGSGPGDSQGTGSDRSLRLIQNLASDLEQFIGRSSESHTGKMESISGSSEEDALEVARQVAKEVEQEMEKYRKPLGSTSSDMEMQDANVFSTHESPETTAYSHDLVKESSCDPDHEVRSKTNTETLDQSDMGALGCAQNQKLIIEKKKAVTEIISGPGFSDGAFDSTSGKCANSAIFVVAIDGEDSTAQEFKGSSNVHILNVSSALESGTSGETMQRVMSTSFTTPGLSGNKGSGLDFHSAKPSELNSPPVEPRSPQKALVSVACTDAIERPIFDLNEGFNIDEGMQEELTSSISVHVTPADIPEDHVISSNGLTAPIAVVASANATFIPPASPAPINKAYGWKGSAATSAFRPAEPRRMSEMQNFPGDTVASEPVPMSITKQVRAPLDIDLNIADDRLIEGLWLPTDQSEGSAIKITTQAMLLPFTNLSGIGSTNYGFMSSALQPMQHISTRRDLDLNRVDESDEGSTHLRADLRVPGNLASIEPRTHATCSLRNVVRDFDLNDGPVACFDEIVVLDEPQQHFTTSMGIPSTPTVPGLRISPEIVNVAPWFSPGNPFSAVRLPTYAGTRAESPYTVSNAQPFLGPGIGLTPFSTDLFRAGTAISSSPSVSFPVAGPYQYPTFPFGAGFAFGSAAFGTTSTLYGETSSSISFPSVSSQMTNSGGLLPSFVQPPYVTGFPEDAGADSRGPWGRLNFDLNAGPDFVESEVVREDGLNVRHPFMVSNQMEAFHQVGSAGGVLKRKGPEGGWEAYKSGSRHPTWR